MCLKVHNNTAESSFSFGVRALLQDDKSSKHLLSGTKHKIQLVVGFTVRCFTGG